MVEISCSRFNKVIYVFPLCKEALMLLSGSSSGRKAVLGGGGG